MVESTVSHHFTAWYGRSICKDRAGSRKCFVPKNKGRVGIRGVVESGACQDETFLLVYLKTHPVLCSSPLTELDSAESERLYKSNV